MRQEQIPSPLDRLGTGVPALDSVLGGGFPSAQMHLLLGPPGAGKTTLALQFLREGAARGEAVLYVTLAETEAELRQVAASHGWSLDGVAIRELVPSENELREEQQYTIFYPGEVEFGETMQSVLKEVEERQPTRVVFDSLSELRLMARDMVRYRHHILAVKQFFAGRGSTVLLLDNAEDREQSLESVVHGIVILEQSTPEYGPVRRRLHVPKLRGGNYRSGYHDFQLTTGGLSVHPRLIAAESRDEKRATHVMPSGIAEFDELLGGGLRSGTSALFLGAAGSGKSSLAAQYAAAAAQRGERSRLYIFEELPQVVLERARSLGIALEPAIDEGLVTLEQVDPAQLSPGEFIQQVTDAVEQDGVRLLVIDSLNGYLNAMTEERMVLVQLRELLSYLGQRDVLTILTVAQHGLVGSNLQPPIDVSYLADSVVLLRFFEALGEVRQAISVMKHRVGAHERSIRELRLGSGIQIGETLRDFEGVLSGTPRYRGSADSLLKHDERA